MKKEMKKKGKGSPQKKIDLTPLVILKYTPPEIDWNSRISCPPIGGNAEAMKGTKEFSISSKKEKEVPEW